MTATNEMIYLDNNGTTFMSEATIKAMFAWVNKGNPSSSYKSANDCKMLISKFNAWIAQLCGFTLPRVADSGDHASPPKPTASQYRIIFTSGASESNNTMIRSTVDAYTAATRTTPHIIISAIEHKSILLCCEDLASQGRISYTMIEPDELGFIQPDAVERAILPNTALICVMAANNETGAIIDYKRIGALAHKNQIPFYTDSVQIFGKFPIQPTKENVDAFSVSFHKLYGPAGIGLLVIKEQLVVGYQLKPIICGMQNYKMRGGTENIMLYAGAFASAKENFMRRDAKNKKLLALKRIIMTEISKHIPARTYQEYLETKNDKIKNSAEVIFISTATKNYLPNTILFTLVKRTPPFICNVDFKKDLESRGIIVSIGSACNTTSTNASHVVHSMKIDSLLRKGMLRLSLGDHNTEEEARLFVRVFLQTAKAHLESS